MLPETSWFVGCGNMGGAMVAGWRKAGLDLSGMTAVSPSGREIDGVNVVTEIPEGQPDWCVIGFKPQMLGDIAPTLSPHIGEQTVLLSILAGAQAQSLRKAFPNARAIVRLMPNLPVSEGEGVTAIYSDDADEALRVTGYPRGAITPFGCARPLPVIADERVAAGGIVSVGGGAHGVAVHLDGAELVAVLGAEVAAVTAPA